MVTLSTLRYDILGSEALVYFNNNYNVIYLVTLSTLRYEILGSEALVYFNNNYNVIYLVTLSTLRYDILGSEALIYFNNNYNLIIFGHAAYLEVRDLGQRRVGAGDEGGHREHGGDAEGDPGRHGVATQPEGDPGEDDDQTRRDVDLDHVVTETAHEQQRTGEPRVVTWIDENSTTTS